MISNNLNIGILAHVDAGKTTLSEALLFKSGALRSAGRVDHGDAFLDTYSLEKSRGITIFSKQARLSWKNRNITLTDTPGHADFSPEMERTLQILDCAILVISALDGVTGQVQILWRLLSHVNVPVFIFVNKMDQAGSDKGAIISELSKLSSHIVDFSSIDQSFWEKKSNDSFESKDKSLLENIALCDEKLLDGFIDGNGLSYQEVSDLILGRKLFPCFWGSALKMEGTDNLLSAIANLMPNKEYPDDFGALCYKISRDENGNRLTWIKLSGGKISVRETINYSYDESSFSEKITGIRLYSGSSYEAVQNASSGDVVALTGLSHIFAGDRLGSDTSFSQEGLMQPILTCRVLLTDDEDPFIVYQDLKLIEEEAPEIGVSKNEKTGEIFVQVMGKVQMEILQNIMMERFSIPIDFGEGQIVYKETISSPTIVIGHFEPLRHYAEVVLLLTPTGTGSGLTFESNCPTDILGKNWQRLIMTHLAEKKHRGVLTGSEITDMKITLIGGKASIKHTEGGDFRQATYRAVRQGLMNSESILLEPVYSYTITVPKENLGRALSDIQMRNGTCNAPEFENEEAILSGSIPAACLGDYATEINAYTKGQGRITVSLRDYEPCHNPEEVIKNSGYEPELDMVNPSSSVFCSHGAGTSVSWDKVRDYMHTDLAALKDGDATCSSGDESLQSQDSFQTTYRTSDNLKAFSKASLSATNENLSFEERQSRYFATEKELSQIFEKTYGPVKTRYSEKDDNKREYYPETKDVNSKGDEGKYTRHSSSKEPLDEYLLVDGYNLLFASDSLSELASKNINSAREKLMDILSGYQGMTDAKIILIFDAYKVSGGLERVYRYHNIDIVYTKESETADQYIEKTAHNLARKHKVTVATSDGVEQVIIMGSGALRLSSKDFWSNIKSAQNAIRSEYLDKQNNKLHNYVIRDEGDTEEYK